MSKKSFYSAFLVLAALVFVLAAVAGCSRPKPEAKETPVPGVTEVVPTQTPESAPTQIVTEPTVVTTKPTVAVAEPTSAASESEGAATPTAVVIIPATAVPTTAPVAEGGTGEWFLYTIQWGDTLYSLAARYGTTVDAITALNDINADEVQAGQQIKIPQTGTTVAPQPGESVEYVVQAGDDLNLIATKFGVSVEAIVQANGLSNPDFIYVGQKLVISSSGGTTSTVSSGGTTHVVKPGESVDTIAAQYNTTREAIVSANNLVNPNWIYVGQELTIP